MSTAKFIALLAAIVVLVLGVLHYQHAPKYSAPAYHSGYSQYSHGYSHYSKRGYSHYRYSHHYTKRG